MENQQLSLKPIVYPKILKVYICLYIIKIVIYGGNERNYRYWIIISILYDGYSHNLSLNDFAYIRFVIQLMSRGVDCL